MKTIKEIKKHFKNAKEVRCLSSGCVYDLTKIEITRDIHEWLGYFWIDANITTSSIQIHTIEIEFAEIISYKKPKFKYLEKVIVSRYKDFSVFYEGEYACKHHLKGHVVFTDDEDFVFVYKYIKKIK